MMKKILFIFLVSSFCILGFSQNPRQIIDSLKKELNKNPTELQKAKIYGDLCWYYNSVSIDSALIYGNKSVKLAKIIEDENLYAQSLSDLGAVYYLHGNMNGSLSLYNKSLKIRKSQKNEERIAALNSKIGNIYQKKLDFPLAMSYNIEALKYYEKINKQENIAILESNIGVIYFNMKNYKKALEHFKKATIPATNKNLKSTLSNALIGIGNVHKEQKNYKLAEENYIEVLKISEETNNFLTKSTALQNIADIYRHKKLFDKALEFSRQALEIRESQKLLYEAEKSRIFIGKVYNALGKYKIAKLYLIKSLKNSQKNGNKDNLDELYTQLIPVYASETNVDSVNYFLDRRNSAINIRTNKDVMQISTDLETKYQTKKKERQIQKQKVEIINKERKINKILIVGSTISALLLLIIYLVYKNQKLKNKQQKQEYELTTAISKIETQNKLQEQRLSISRDLHDNIGAQLTFIISSIETLKQAFNITDDKINHKLLSISNFTKETITELRDTIWAMNHAEIDINEIRSRILSFVDKAQTSNEHINITFERDSVLDNLYFSSVEGMNIFRITQEAVNNAMKYSGAQNITLNAKKIDNQIKIIIKDDGKGFDINKTELGNGILNMQKRASELKAIISIESEIGKGTSIILTIPKAKT